MSKNRLPPQNPTTIPTLLDMHERSRFEPFIHQLADAAQKVTMRFFDTGVSVEEKPCDSPNFDPVTEADRGAEAAIRALIDRCFPAHGIRGEEFGVKSGEDEFNWVLDPIDGTRAYISALPVWGTLIALSRAGRPVLGLMDQPITAERFWGFGDQAFLQKADAPKSKLQTRKCASLAEATIATTDPYLFKAGERQGFENVRVRSRLQRYGLDCYAYASVARGGLDLVMESGLQDYDIAALIPIVEGAGGIVSNWRGEPAWQGGQVLACGDARVHAEALAVLNDYAL